MSYDLYMWKAESRVEGVVGWITRRKKNLEYFRTPRAWRFESGKFHWLHLTKRLGL